MITKHDKLRLLCRFQHWLGTHYNNLPTDSGNMTERSRKFLKDNEQAFSLFDVSVNEVAVCSCGNKITDKELFYDTCLQCGEAIPEQTER